MAKLIGLKYLRFYDAIMNFIVLAIWRFIVMTVMFWGEVRLVAYIYAWHYTCWDTWKRKGILKSYPQASLSSQYFLITFIFSPLLLGNWRTLSRSRLLFTIMLGLEECRNSVVRCTLEASPSLILHERRQSFALRAVLARLEPQASIFKLSCLLNYYLTNSSMIKLDMFYINYF